MFSNEEAVFFVSLLCTVVKTAWYPRQPHSA